MADKLDSVTVERCARRYGIREGRPSGGYVKPLAPSARLADGSMRFAPPTGAVPIEQQMADARQRARTAERNRLFGPTPPPR